MLFLLGGCAVLGGLLLLVYLFVNADPKRLARNLKWTAIALAAVAASRWCCCRRCASSRPCCFRSPCRCRCCRGFAALSTATATPAGRPDFDRRQRLSAHDARSRYRHDDRHGVARQSGRDAGRGTGLRRPAGAVARVPRRRRGRGAAARSLSRPPAPGLARRIRRRAQAAMRRGRSRRHRRPRRAPAMSASTRPTRSSASPRAPPSTRSRRRTAG